LSVDDVIVAADADAVDDVDCKYNNMPTLLIPNMIVHALL
jgi:hypothetical protein